MPKWPRDPDAVKLAKRDFWNQAWGFFLGLLAAVLLLILIRNC
jgi:hypothetical protein